MKTKKVYTTKNILISALTILAGIALYFLSQAGGVTIILIGACLLVFYRSGWKIEGQEGIFRKESLTISRDDKKAILDYINGDSTSLELDSRASCGGLLMDLYSNGSNCFVQLFDFENYCYNEICELTPVDSAKAQQLREASPESKK